MGITANNIPHTQEEAIATTGGVNTDNTLPSGDNLEVVNNHPEIPNNKFTETIIALLKDEPNEYRIFNALQSDAGFSLNKEGIWKSYENIERDKADEMILKPGMRKIMLTGKYVTDHQSTINLNPSLDSVIKILEGDHSSDQEIIREILELFEEHLSIS